MRLASSRNSITNNIVDEQGEISVRKAINYLRRPLRHEARDDDQREDEEAATNEARRLLDLFKGDELALGQHLLDRPFCAYDVWHEDSYWFGTKLLHHAGVNGTAGAMLDMARRYEPIPLLRLVPADELHDAAQRLYPFAFGKAPLRMEARTNRDAKGIIGYAEIFACLMFGAILHEIDHRKEIDDETFSAEFEDCRRRLVATAEARIAAIEDVQARNKRGEYETIEQYAAAFHAAEKVPEPSDDRVQGVSLETATEGRPIGTASEMDP